MIWAWIIGQLLNIALYETGIIDLGTMLILFVLWTNTALLWEFTINTHVKRTMETP